MLYGNLSKDLYETIRCAPKKKTPCSEKNEDLIQEIYILEQIIDTSNNSNELINSISNKRQACDILYDNKMNGILLRSKTLHVENNEKKQFLFCKP